MAKRVSQNDFVLTMESVKDKVSFFDTLSIVKDYLYYFMRLLTGICGYCNHKHVLGQPGNL